MKIKKDFLLSKRFSSSPIEEQVETLTLLSSNKTNKKQILVDVSSVITHNINTGIPRVVKQQLKYLLQLAKKEYGVIPVYLKNIDEKYYFVYANNYLLKFTNKNHQIYQEDSPINLSCGDILYSADLSYESVSQAIKSNIYNLYKNIGVKIIFLIHDILPISHPEYFESHIKAQFTLWLNQILSISNILITTTNTTKNQLYNYILMENKILLENLQLISIPLGSDIPTNNKDIVVTDERLLNLSGVITFIVVGTIEPRKGHSQLLKAFDLLWNQGFKLNLILVGKKGWKTETLIDKVQYHSKLNTQLLWLEAVSDEILNQAYKCSTALIQASFNEGFGLPLVEAANSSLPIVARDIPVFKEIAKNNAFYFKDTKDENDLVLAIKEWIYLYKQNKHPKSEDMKIYSWEENTAELLEIFNKNTK